VLSLESEVTSTSQYN